MYVVVTANDAAGNVSAFSNEVKGIPQYVIGWANLQWPPTLTHEISATDRTDNVYGQVWIDGVTSQPGATVGLQAQAGFGPDGSDPATSGDWTWVDATFNIDAGNNDEFVASFLPEATGAYDYVYRYSTTNGATWLYADLGGPVVPGTPPSNPGAMTVNPSADTSAPAAPTGLSVVAASPAGIELTWDALVDPTLYGYEVRRGDASGGPYTTLAFVTRRRGSRTRRWSPTRRTGTSCGPWTCRSTGPGRPRRSRRPPSSGRSRSSFTVTVPAGTDGSGRSVYIAGFLDRLDGGLPQWDPGGVVLTRADATHWTIQLTGKEGTQLEYKYALGSWDYVEKDAAAARSPTAS